MTKRMAALTSVVLLALGIAAFTGSALAGNGNKGKDRGSASQNAGAQTGVKPTNSTAKGTTCSTGGGTGSSATCKATGSGAANASSAGKADSSKRYGNGSTAAQIANSRGAPANTILSGPGNSQPHKVWDCRKNHWVDVHAVKSYSSASCGAQASTASRPKNASSSSHGAGGNATSAGGVLGMKATPGTGGAASPSSPQGGVLGVTASQQSHEAEGVLGAIQSAGQGTLPFTGFPLWIVVLAAVGLIVLGLGLRRRARATA